MNDYTRTSPTQWTWNDGSRSCAVRVFHSTHTLIWSAWFETNDGPQFDDGIRQTVETFLLIGLPLGLTVPDTLLVDLCASLGDKHHPRKGRFCNG